MSYEFNFSAVWTYRALLLRGLLVSLEIFALSLVISTAIGLMAAIGRLSRSRALSVASGTYVEFIRGTPILTQIFWVYFALPILFGIEVSRFIAGVLAISLHMGAYGAEIFRAGIQSIERGQVEAAQSLGLSRSQTLKRIVLPQAIARMIPPFVSHSIVLLKLTSLVSVIGVADFFYGINQINQVESRSVEFYTVAALVYFGMVLPFSLVLNRLESKLRVQKSG